MPQVLTDASHFEEAMAVQSVLDKQATHPITALHTGVVVK